MHYIQARSPPLRYGSTHFFSTCLLRAANNSGRLKFYCGLFDIRNHNGHVKGLQRFDFEEVIPPHIDYTIAIHAQHNEHLKCLVIEESAAIGLGQVRLVGVLLRLPPHHMFGCSLFFRGSFSVFVHVLKQNFLVARNSIRHTIIQGKFQVLGKIVPSSVRQAQKSTHDPSNPRSLKIFYVIHAASRAPWKSRLQSILPRIPLADPGNLD